MCGSRPPLAADAHATNGLDRSSMAFRWRSSRRGGILVGYSRIRRQERLECGICLSNRGGGRSRVEMRSGGWAGGLASSMDYVRSLRKCKRQMEKSLAQEHEESLVARLADLIALHLRCLSETNIAFSSIDWWRRRRDPGKAPLGALSATSAHMSS